MCIVVGIDFSEHSRAAADVAAGLARKLEVRLRLVHAVDPWLSQRFTGGDAASVLAPAREALEAERARLSRAFEIEIDADVLMGMPDEVLVQTSAQASGSLIVTSALGWRSEARWKLGGIAERLARHTCCPFLMVREAAPFLDWTAGKRPLRVVFADDLTEISDAALEWVRVLRRAGPVEATVAHVYVPQTEHRRLGLSWAQEDEVNRVLADEVQERVARHVPGGARVRVAPEMGRAAESLIDIGREVRADLLVLGTHQYGLGRRIWRGSVSHAVLNDAPVSVACIPSTRQKAEQAEVPPVQRILVPTDFSPLANAAIAQAYALAPPGGEVVLFAAVEVGVEEAPLTAGEEAEYRRRLEALIPPDAAAREVRTRTEVAAAVDVARAIAQAAERVGADLICMATHGRTGARRVLMGSVAQEVLTRSERPVTLVRPRQ